MTTYYISDTHFGHANIIKFCERPFANTYDMDAHMVAEIHRVCAQPDARLIHAGDFGFRVRDSVFCETNALPNRDVNIIVPGNHDRDFDRHFVKRNLSQWFGAVEGTRDTWRSNYVIIDDVLKDCAVKVMVSHQPQQDLRGCAYNVYGHVHNNLYRETPEQLAYWRLHPAEDNRWVQSSWRHLNACVEITGYRPRTLEWLLELKAEWDAPYMSTGGVF